MSTFLRSVLESCESYERNASDDADKRDCEDRSHVHVFIYSGD